MKKTLRECLALADNVMLDDLEVIEFSYRSLDTIKMERKDEMQFAFGLDLVLDLDGGRAFADDLNGEEHDLVFWLHHRLGDN